MKRYILPIVCILSAVASATAQLTQVSLPGRNVTLSELFRQIERQSGAVVMYDADKLSLSRSVTLSQTRGEVTELLDQALPALGCSYRINDRHILVRAAGPQPASQPAPQSPQPTRSEFERDVHDYTRRHIDDTPSPEQTIILYDTIRTEKPHSGVFTYPSRQTPVKATSRAARTPFTRDTPPLVAVKTNLAWWAAGGTLNIAGEVGLGKRTSLELSGGLNRWNLKGSVENNRKMTHWVVKPEFRYWLCERFTTGHFLGLHAIYAQYNVGGHDIPMLFQKEFRYEGDAWGGGVGYGYNLAFSQRWGVEFTAGLGLLRLNYVKKDCEKCGSEVGRYGKTYFGPTSLGVKLTFTIK